MLPVDELKWPQHYSYYEQQLGKKTDKIEQAIPEVDLIYGK
jgi:hypothetical protein